MSLDEYLVVFWKNTLKLHTRQDLEDFMTYLLKLDLLEVQLEVISLTLYIAWRHSCPSKLLNRCFK